MNVMDEALKVLIGWLLPLKAILDHCPVFGSRFVFCFVLALKIHMADYGHSINCSMHGSVSCTAIFTFIKRV